MKLISSKCIWHNGKHNAFTDLCYFNNRYFIAFRSAENHHSFDGEITILVSDDGSSWQQIANISLANSDLRDPKFCLHPNGKIMLYCAAVSEINENKSLQSMVFISRDGKEWDAGHNIGEQNIWIWRAKWFSDSCHAIGYACTQEKFIRLYHSNDGINFEPLVSSLFNVGFCNELDWIYQDDGSMLILLRRDGEVNNTAMLGISSNNHKDWQWSNLGIRIGGPCLLQLSNKRIIAAVRIFSEAKANTSVFEIDPDTRSMKKILTLPSGGDCSYPGMLQHENEIWISYYSSHEKGTNIYLAKLEI